MRKVITIFALACIGYVPASQAQVYFTEDFEGTSGNALPAGWTQTNVGATTWQTGTNTTLSSTSFTIPAHTRMIGFNDDAAGNTVLNTNQFLKTPVINMATSTSPVLKMEMHYFAGIYQNIQERLTLEVSTNGGTNWTVIDTISGNDLTLWQTRFFPLTGCAGQANVMVGFRYTDNSGWLFGAMMDDMEIYNQPANDVALTSTNFPKIALNNTPISINVLNLGSATLTAVNAQYDVDGGTPVTQNFTGLNVAPFATTTLTFTTNVSGFTTVGTHTINLNITTVNGGADANPADNVDMLTFVPATQSVTKNGLIEEFSSSTCPPCAGFNAVFDPLVVAQGANTPAANFNVIKYQMNWPSPGTDKSYNPHGDTRKTYYGVGGIPDHYTNGLPGGAGDIAEINASKAGPAFLQITGTYEMNNNNTFDVAYSVTPYFTITGNYSIHAAAVQWAYDLAPNDPTKTTSQSHFVFVQRQMFPNGNGTAVTSWTGGTPVTGTWNNTPYAVGAPAQGNFQFWSHPIGSDLIVFVQDNATKEILQSQSIPAAWPTNVPTIANETKVLIYPNPAVDYTVLGLDMPTASDVVVNITDAMGRVVYNKAQYVTAGRHDLAVSTVSFAAGLYNVTIKTDKGMLTQRLTVAK